MKLKSINHLRRDAAVAVLVALTTVMTAVPAGAQPTGVDVAVATAITLTGPAGQVGPQGTPVTFTVETNNVAGYVVTVGPLAVHSATGPSRAGGDELSDDLPPAAEGGHAIDYIATAL